MYAIDRMIIIVVIVVPRMYEYCIKIELLYIRCASHDDNSSSFSISSNRMNSSQFSVQLPKDIPPLSVISSAHFYCSSYICFRNIIFAWVVTVPVVAAIAALAMLALEAFVV